MTEEKNIIPSHIAILMDGNRRWAKKRGLPGASGHKAGADNMYSLISAANQAGIRCITFWAFSTENWKRTKEEVTYIFNLVKEFALKFKGKCLEEKIRFVHLGRKDRIPLDLKELIEEMETATRTFQTHTVAIALDYGGHDEIIRAVQKTTENHLEINEHNIERFLDTATLPQIDYIIRTGGECRLSGFMSWQSAYAEYYFTHTFFPDFDGVELKKALDSYCGRERRFGGDSPNKTS